jgi:hypothetical protein
MIQDRALDGITIGLAVVTVLPIVLCSIIFFSLVTVFNSLRQARKLPKPYIVEVVEIYGSEVQKTFLPTSRTSESVCANHSAIQDKGDLAILTLR